MNNIKNNSKEIIATFPDFIIESRKYLFSDYDKYKEIMAPIYDWSYSIGEELMRIVPELSTKAKVKRFLQEQDTKLAMLRGEEDTKENRMKLLKVYEDSEYLITSIIDYDYDTTLWKMTIYYKPLDYRYMESFDIGNW